MKTVNSYIQKSKKQSTKKKGIKTNLTIVKEYLKRFTGFIIRAHKNVLKTID